MLTGWREKCAACFWIPQRYVLGIMACLAVVNAYTMRVCLSVALTEMVVPHNKTQHFDPDACPAEDGNSTEPEKLGGTFKWDEPTQGLVLSSFFWGYVLTHLPGGILAEKFGGKYSLGLGILSTAIFTLLTPLVVELGDWQWLVVLRFLEGLGEGTTFPALNALLARWIPASERGKLGTLVFSGSQIGTVIGTSISGVLIAYTKHWSSVFYFFGAAGVLWFIFFTLLCYSEPQTHPFITDEELKFLEQETGGRRKKLVVPWKSILTSWPLWALVCAQIGHDWGFFTMVTDLPKYMKDVLKFNIKSNALFSSVPYIIMWVVSMMSGWLCDWLIAKNHLTTTMARKLFTTVANVGPGIFILAASYAGCDRALVVVFFTLAMGIMGAFYPGMKVNALDLSPNFAGTLMAIVNGIGAISGIVTPYLIGVLTQNHTLLEWRLVFWIALGVFGVTSVIFILFASGETQPWNDAKPSNKEETHQKKTVQNVDV